MAQYGEDVYGTIPHYSNRSPGSIRTNNMIYRQSSQPPLPQFDTYRGQTMPQGLYTAEDHVAAAVAGRYDLNPRFDRLPPATLHSNYPFDNQTWNYGGPNPASIMSGTGRLKQTARRPGLPNSWIDQTSQLQNMSTFHMNGQYNSVPFHQNQRRASPTSASDSEELIPTALVIKNIPFAVKKEQIIQLMTDLNLPLPYAFNYHFDQGVFRGLAFANFSSPDETKTVIEHMNSMDLNGRKLRVEYKKMLPIQERERIERDKREKRGQLEEQHRPIPPGQAQNPLHNQASMNSVGSNNHPVSPSPVSMRDKFGTDIDLNDPISLGYYTEIVLFKKDATRESLIFPASVSPADRRQIHTIAHYLGLEHRSQGEGESRCVQILKKRASEISPPPLPQLSGSFYNESRRGLNRAATIDFAEARSESYHTRNLAHQASGHLLEIPQSPGLGGINGAHNLRAAKSFADLRSYTPSPVPSAASFPVGLSQNVARYTDYAHSSAVSGTPNLTPTSAGGMSHRDEAYLNNNLSNNLSNLSLFDTRVNRPNGTGRIGQERESHTSTAGPIGSQRPVNNGSKADDAAAAAARNGSTLSHREPRNPGPDWGAGNGSFSRPRQNGHVARGSAELDLSSLDNGWDDSRTPDTADRNTTLTRPNRYK